MYLLPALATANTRTMRLKHHSSKPFTLVSQTAHISHSAFITIITFQKYHSSHSSHTYSSHTILLISHTIQPLTCHEIHSQNVTLCFTFLTPLPPHIQSSHTLPTHILLPHAHFTNHTHFTPPTLSSSHTSLLTHLTPQKIT